MSWENEDYKPNKPISKHNPLKNLRAFLEVHTLDKDTPVFASILKWMVGDDVLNRFTPIQATEKTPLVITINSFSYKKGLPSDASENGGGFM